MHTVKGSPTSPKTVGIHGQRYSPAVAYQDVAQEAEQLSGQYVVGASPSVLIRGVEQSGKLIGFIPRRPLVQI